MTQKLILQQVTGGRLIILLTYSVRDRLIERFNDTTVTIDECNCKRVYEFCNTHY